MLIGRQISLWMKPSTMGWEGPRWEGRRLSVWRSHFYLFYTISFRSQMHHSASCYRYVSPKCWLVAQKPRVQITLISTDSTWTKDVFPPVTLCNMSSDLHRFHYLYISWTRFLNVVRNYTPGVTLQLKGGDKEMMGLFKCLKPPLLTIRTVLFLLFCYLNFNISLRCYDETYPWSEEKGSSQFCEITFIKRRIPLTQRQTETSSHNDQHTLCVLFFIIWEEHMIKVIFPSVLFTEEKRGTKAVHLLPPAVLQATASARHFVVWDIMCC